MTYTDKQIELFEKETGVTLGGCGDGNCIIRKPKGQHTNGGCRCMGQDARMVFKWLLSKMERMEGERDELKNFCIWLTGCGYDFTQHEYFVKQRDKLLKSTNKDGGFDDSAIDDVKIIRSKNNTFNKLNKDGE